MSPEGRDFFPSLRLPEFHHLVATARCQSLAIWTECDSTQWGSMPPECKQLLATLRVPYLGSIISRCARETFAVRAESHATDIARVPLARTEFVSRLGVPDLDAISKGAGQTFTIWAESRDEAGALKGCEFVSGVCIPHFGLAGELLAIGA